ncbi:MAG: 2-hydroxychromene-2-carboxylate isomerase [Pseudomonadota bacterium]
MDEPTIDFYFDCSSPWTYLAFHNVQPMAERLGVQIDWKPILVGGIFNSVNPSVYEARKAPVKAKARYHLKDLKDWAKHSGLDINMPPSAFPVNSVKVMRACIVLNGRDQLVRFARAAFEAYWTEDKDISQAEIFDEICQRCGLDAVELNAAIADRSAKDKLRANTDDLIARGGFGSPTMFVGDSMYFGNDRLPLVEAAVLSARGA